MARVRIGKEGEAYESTKSLTKQRKKKVDEEEKKQEESGEIETGKCGLVKENVETEAAERVDEEEGDKVVEEEHEGPEDFFDAEDGQEGEKDEVENGENDKEEGEKNEGEKEEADKNDEEEGEKNEGEKEDEAEKNDEEEGDEGDPDEGEKDEDEVEKEEEADKNDEEDGEKDEDEVEKEDESDKNDEEEREDKGEKLDEGEEEEDEEAKSAEDDETLGTETETDNDQDIENDSQPLPPTRLFFPPSEYTKACKIATRCSVFQTVEYIEGFSRELKWFRRHPQFKHIFHMPKEPNHMTQGMWMLLVRTAETEMGKECWFVVNGVPIRYSMKEHCLLTVLSCREYPDNWKELGNMKLVQKMFGRTRGIKIKQVEEKLVEMKDNSCVERKKLMVLYFLCKVVKAKIKSDGNIDPFLLRIVDDLHACETFPWGRYTFDDCLEGIRSVVKKMKGFVKPGAQPPFPGFIVPLEILPFECIPRLGRKYREDVPAKKDCPRMCKGKFTKCDMKGFPMDAIHETLGSTKDIKSILLPFADERSLLDNLIDDDVDDGIGYIDPVVDCWRKHMIVDNKKIWWKGMYEEDVASREKKDCGVTLESEKVDKVSGVDASIPSIHGVIKDEMEKGFKALMVKLAEIDVKVVDKLKEIDDKVNEIKRVFVPIEEVYYGTMNSNLTTKVVDPQSLGLIVPPIEEIEVEGEGMDGEKGGEEVEGEEEEGEKESEENGDQRTKKKKKMEHELILRTGQKRTRKPKKMFTPGEAKKPKKN